ncbi:hypothetical protein OS493_029164 [Desmophyllum pertusum]|uniref:Uncharacterized protein n=1 Tax=Desmophyllum pertusum TaxID=174260 RepID=A0A9X0D9D8_9CNID|nr:hypothetical protein OS493_029164 [Desmophyllum pertusum]
MRHWKEEYNQVNRKYQAILWEIQCKDCRRQQEEFEIHRFYSIGFHVVNVSEPALSMFFPEGSIAPFHPPSSAENTGKVHRLQAARQQEGVFFSFIVTHHALLEVSEAIKNDFL